MNKVPVEDAAWSGSQLAQLSDDQLRDTLRAAGYDKTTTEQYVRTLGARIKELNRLRDLNWRAVPGTAAESFVEPGCESPDSKSVATGADI